MDDESNETKKDKNGQEQEQVFVIVFEGDKEGKITIKEQGKVSILEKIGLLELCKKILLEKHLHEGEKQ